MAARPKQLQPEMDELIKQLDFTYMDLPELIEDKDECMELRPSDTQKPNPHQQPATKDEFRQHSVEDTKQSAPSAGGKSVRFRGGEVMESRERSNAHLREGKAVCGAACQPGSAPVHPPTPYPHWLSRNQRAQPGGGGLLLINEEGSPMKSIASRIQESEESRDMEE